MIFLKTIIYCLFLIKPIVESYKILYFSPYTVKSEHFLISTLVEEMIKKGHEVTYISAFNLSFDHPKVNLIWIPKLTDVVSSMNLFEMKHNNDMYQRIKKGLKSLIDISWNDERVMNIWKNRKDYDIFITLSFFSEMVFPFLMDFNGCFVLLYTAGVQPFAFSMEGNWLTPAVTPSMSLKTDEYMSFWERSLNLQLSITHDMIQNSFFQYQEQLIKDYIPEFSNIPSYYDRVSLSLINSHFALDGPVPLLPSQIEIGTINAKKPEPLPKNMEVFVQGSGEAGIIFFSLGTHVKSIEIPMNAKKMFIEAFKRVPQRVLWKYEGKDLELPTNVISEKWMPQQDILGHPKTRLFISHCGVLSTQETKYYGVPVLAMPIDFDQPRNAARMARKGYAIVLQWEELTTDKIVEAINILINDTSYKERLETVSRILHDQKDNPAERAVWWLEYVVRHKGAPHLQYAGKRLSLFQYVMLDVIIFWLAVLFFIIFIFVYIIKYLCFSSKMTKIHPRKNKKQLI